MRSHKQVAKKFMTFRRKKAEGEVYPIEKRAEVNERAMPKAQTKSLGEKKAAKKKEPK
jgi:hypothetical protein